MSFFHVSPMSAQHPDHNFHFSVEPRSGDVLILIGFGDMFTFFRKCKNVSMLVAFLVSTTIVNPEGRKERCISDMICDVFVRFGITRELNEPIAPVVRHVPAGFFPQEATLEETDRIVFEKVRELDMTKLKLVIGTMTPERRRCCGAFENSSTFYCL